MDGTIGEIRLFAGTFAPRNWALCQGQLLAISQNTALFSILGTTYGGNGVTTFALPDLRGRLALGTGQGPGLSNKVLGEVSGTETVTLTTSQMPTHTHTGTVTINANSSPGNLSSPAGNFLAGGQDATANPIPTYASAAGGGATLNGGTVTLGNSGSNLPFSISNPYLALTYIICLTGIFPSRN